MWKIFSLVPLKKPQLSIVSVSPAIVFFRGNKRKQVSHTLGHKPHNPPDPKLYKRMGMGPIKRDMNVFKGDFFYTWMTDMRRFLFSFCLS